MVPLRDENPTSSTPYVTYGLVILNVLIFLYEITLPPDQLAQFFDTWAIVPAELTASLSGQASGP
ncbi:MAG TPA: rhomboid family intramembrane serine protease, partial [Trichocoleus sp.]